MRSWLIGMALMAVAGPAGADLIPDAPAPLRPIGDPATWISFGDYPPAALRVGAQGATSVSFVVSPAGLVADCTIAESSGNADLDRAACQALATRARYEPSRTGGTVRRRVVWKMPAKVPIEVAKVPAEQTLEAEILVGPGGVVQSCRVIQPIPAPPSNPCTAMPVGRSFGPGFVRDGKPVSTVIRQKMTLTTTFP